MSEQRLERVLFSHKRKLEKVMAKPFFYLALFLSSFLSAEQIEVVSNGVVSPEWLEALLLEGGLSVRVVECPLNDYPGVIKKGGGKEGISASKKEVKLDFVHFSARFSQSFDLQSVTAFCKGVFKPIAESCNRLQVKILQNSHPKNVQSRGLKKNFSFLAVWSITGLTMSLIILGIDPGTAITGYGVIETTGSSHRVIDYPISRDGSPRINS